jgi:hypothetical protein
MAPTGGAFASCTLSVSARQTYRGLRPQLVAVLSATDAAILSRPRPTLVMTTQEAIVNDSSVRAKYSMPYSMPYNVLDAQD